MTTFDQIKEAIERIKDYTIVTPLRRSDFLSNLTDTSVFLKLENEQVTGSFKVRGALNRLFTLSRHELERGVVTASTGNHGLGITYAAFQLGIQARVVFPLDASEDKLEKMKSAGAEIIQKVGYEEIESYAREYARKKGLTYVSPYNDTQIIAGAGTTGLEILTQLEHVDVIIVPIGGGGLISGIAIAVKTHHPEVQIIGVQSEMSPEVYHSWLAGHWVEVEESESLAQGLMGGVESDSITLDIIQQYVDRIILVSEKSILEAIRLLYEKEGLLIEGAGAASTAVLLQYPDEFRGKQVVLVLSGGNIGKEDILSLLSRT